MTGRELAAKKPNENGFVLGIERGHYLLRKHAEKTAHVNQKVEMIVHK